MFNSNLYKYANANYLYFLTKKFLSKKIETQKIVSRSQIKESLENKDNIIKKQIKASGPGGQHVNKTNSCVFLKDLNTDISVFEFFVSSSSLRKSTYNIRNCHFLNKNKILLIKWLIFLIYFYPFSLC